MKNTGEGIDRPTELDLIDAKINPEILNNKKWLAETEKEIRRGYSSHIIRLQTGESTSEGAEQIGEPIYEDNIEVRIYFPNREEDVDVSEAYNKKYNELLGDSDHKTWEELLMMLDQRGVWTRFDEKEYRDSPDTITQMAEEVIMADQSKIYRGKRIDKKGIKKLQETYRKRAYELVEKSNKRYGYYVNSIESLANVHSMHIQAVKCIKRKKEKQWVPVWTEKSIGKDYSFNNNVFLSLLQKAIVFWRGQPQELLMKPPEEIQGESKKTGKNE